MTEVILVTGNENKLREFKSILSNVNIKNKNIDLVEIQDISVEVVAKHKAREAYKILQKPVIVEDTALILDEFKNLPGPFIKFFEESFPKESMIKMLGDVKNRDAKVIAVAVYYNGKKEIVSKGEVFGTITHKAREGEGFGFDYYFIPEGYDKTFSELGPEIKNKISHRKKAIEGLRGKF